MQQTDYKKLVAQLTQGHPAQRMAAHFILIALQEQAVEPLIDELYAGVSDQQGAAIIKVLAEIGGPDALMTLRDVFERAGERPALQQAAALGLLRNVDNLSPDERDHVAAFLAH
jgi:HEAT repeat protein